MITHVYLYNDRTKFERRRLQLEVWYRERTNALFFAESYLKKIDIENPNVYIWIKSDGVLCPEDYLDTIALEGYVGIAKLHIYNPNVDPKKYRGVNSALLVDLFAPEVRV